MGIRQETVTRFECDECGNDIPANKVNKVPKGTMLAGSVTNFEQVLCGKCLCEKAGYRPAPEIKVQEKIVYQSSGGGGWRGPSGRPFPTQSPLVPQQSGSWTSCAPGPGTSPAGSALPSTLLGRLLTCLTPGT